MTWRRTRTTERHYGGWGGYDGCQRRIPDDQPGTNRGAHLLAELYETVVLPEAVWTEIVVDGEGQPGARAVQSATWIERQAVANRDLVRALRQDVDKGEAEAVALAVETEDVLLLMDERLGRETADHFNRACVGLIGVLIEAKENEHVDALRPYLQALRSEAGFWINDQLYRRVLRDEGELP